ncbi:metallophosphoesterase domain-containing protein 1 [Eurytemora carolleeae]|uniref:metallophosphoesterase domain-containing protein 1 n=1 Tax=Eurytemora carolleeae TaxID=1294199 RepID=UPI000C769F4D|nr:metallophosphoesterase domain-containing protein 1 [Eurytemora carolleeae]XP_023349872.1 metallophosphoesterase domain-containing protein 1 [Eurytemora carolleeae]XP_023349873.1 metallophosphoesterase domain-containing protein 1 [Eurytemora carolleeae]XP_023349874.1 metallophosphoesterase domain-containing protein 1 [Eurytemora carolleeae]XP_023349875.1 metallophosphoesterase domain-containing protein 1 [Eurytemora carolleeae]XP_023349876.1 metallophosphoesterase domain-containing protein 1|eukprot:XP_023349871.1 metallophosphoesterase domain-containing protein 1-like [Eurytemora affinis]
MRLNVKSPSTPVAENKVRFVCMSDTHSLTSHIKQSIPDGDVFIHAGDFTRCGSVSEVRDFNAWISKLPHKHKIVIAGNHELSFDNSFQGLNMETTNCRSEHLGNSPLHISQKMLYTPTSASAEDKEPVNSTATEMQKELTECTYLEDSGIVLYGLNIYGTPWQPEFGNWAFNLVRGEQCLQKWNQIPENTDILITHSPPVGFGDLCSTGIRAGCVDLLNTVQLRVKPKYHVYGHIHEGYGIRSDGQVVYVNASTCDINYIPCNPPIVFDINLPAGQTKS